MTGISSAPPGFAHIFRGTRSNELSDHYCFVVQTQDEYPQLPALSLSYLIILTCPLWVVCGRSLLYQPNVCFRG